ncbi:hypothetical protein A3D88_00570 [Candidatus Peribacteria bacterium RIFCSPHIGHO2_02_FULL_52_16]|nr:MAG: hypothetical protein A2706_01355 [Candidatus Peribacteria bacterium RIFCSPHIGHO2_01_FULL_51_35]OGJ61966.1 MAG: hypothetical protein A3D88_00570 [Candidatus Peribacteria bacterium RIFCSPHIGHO2_02_FULL_52_16]
MQNQQNLQNPARPVIPTGQELYDSLMGHIEPDLTTESLKMLEQKYAGETPEQTAVRKQRYDLAFERYDQAYADYVETLHAQAHRYRRQSFVQAEVENREQEGGILNSLHQAMFPSA